jgi:hypothetical protein
MLPPLERALVTAQRFVKLANEIDGESAGDAEGGPRLGDKQLSEASVAALLKRDGEAVRAFESLQTWYRPVDTLATRERRMRAVAPNRPRRPSDDRARDSILWRAVDDSAAHGPFHFLW